MQCYLINPTHSLSCLFMVSRRLKNYIFTKNVVAWTLDPPCSHCMHSTFHICQLFRKYQFVLTERQFIIRWSCPSFSIEINLQTESMKFKIWHFKILALNLFSNKRSFAKELFADSSRFEESPGSTDHWVDNFSRCVKTEM